MTFSFSSCVNVGDSPVVPTATRPVIPAAICASTNFSNAAKSTSPFRNGVTNAVKVPRNICQRSNFYRPLKRKLRRAGECDVSKLVPCSLKINAEFAATANSDADWPIHLLSHRKNQRAGNDARSAGKRFVLHAALVGSHQNFLRAAFLDKIYIRALRRKFLVTADRRALGKNMDDIEPRHGDNHMLNAAVDVMDHRIFTIDLQPQVQPQVRGIAHIQRDEVTMQSRTDESGRRLERNSLGRAGDLFGKARQTARAISAHFRFAAVAIIITHPKIGAVRSFLKQKNPVRAHSAMAIANPNDLLRL